MGEEEEVEELRRRESRRWAEMRMPGKRLELQVGVV